MRGKLPGILLLLLTALAAAGGALSRKGHTVILPPVGWVFTMVPGWQPWLGWLVCTASAALGLWLVLARPLQITPMTARKLKRFGEIGRGVWSLRILLALVALACLDQCLVGKRALAVKHDGQWVFPAFRKEIYPASTFGQSGEAETDYRKLAETLRQAGRGNDIVLPPVPWDPTFDTATAIALPLEWRDGRLHDKNGRVYSGLAQRFDPANPELRIWQARFRDGLQHLGEEGFDDAGNIVFTAVWDRGTKVSEDRREGADLLLERPAGPWMEIDHLPIAPHFGRRHYLGTDSRGWDVAAQLYGGFQVILQASVLYLLITYAVGTSLGLLMGFWGGIFDLLMQRIIEILSSIPFLYLVIILVSILEKENINLPLIIGVFCLFSWIGCSYYMRSATYREKARDYVAAARVMGAGPGRILFKHILPNTIALLVTLIPFSITGISSALTSLDFIGFGLPEKYPSWGRLLADGVEYLRTSPWIVLSVFTVIVVVLLLVTFVGEALREAFDPKKFTTYR